MWPARPTPCDFEGERARLVEGQSPIAVIIGGVPIDVWRRVRLRDSDADGGGLVDMAVEADAALLGLARLEATRAIVGQAVVAGRCRSSARSGI
jgi:hypothetical protein